MDPTRLREKLARVEALFAGATTDGERQAAAHAKERIQLRLAELAGTEPPVELRFSIPELWQRKLLLALLRRYGLKPYRHRGQRHASVMVTTARRLIEETILPEFRELSTVIRTHVDQITNRIVAEFVDKDVSDAAEIAPDRALLSGSDA